MTPIATLENLGILEGFHFWVPSGGLGLGIARLTLQVEHAFLLLSFSFSAAFFSPFTQYLGTWDFGTSNCSAGFGEVYSFWLLGPSGRSRANSEPSLRLQNRGGNEHAQCKFQTDQNRSRFGGTLLYIP